MIYFEVGFQLITELWLTDISNYTKTATHIINERNKSIRGFRNPSNKVHAALQEQTYKKFKIFKSKVVRRKV